MSLRSLCPDLSDPSSLTKRTSDNQRLRTSNDTTSVAKHPTLKSQLDSGTDYSLASFLSRWIPVDESAGRQLRDVNVALIAIMPFETPLLVQRIFNQWAQIKLLNFIYGNLRCVISYHVVVKVDDKEHSTSNSICVTWLSFQKGCFLACHFAKYLWCLVIATKYRISQFWL